MNIYKLKDDVEMKELEKYGFEYKFKNKFYQEMELSKSHTENIFIESDDRIFKNDFDGVRGCECEVCEKIVESNIQNLIKDELVEKVSD